MDADLTIRWSAEGVLPTFSTLLETSAWCRFDIPPEYSSGMIWPTINSGLRPAEHRSGFGTQIASGTYRLRPRDVAGIRGTPFWQHLAALGRSVTIADVPFSPVLPECGGLQFRGWGQHDWAGRPASFPADLLHRLETRYGKYPLHPAMDFRLETESLLKLRRELSAAIEARASILEDLAGRSSDVLFAAFPESHVAGHMFWHLSDPAHPEHSPGQTAAVGNALRDSYAQLDRALARVLAKTGPGTCTVVLFSHGMGPNYHGDHLFPELVRRFNAARSPASSASPVGATERIWRQTVARLPERLRRAVKKNLPVTFRRWASAKRAQNAPGWRTSPAFAMPNLDGFSGLRVNLAGREPQGIVTAGDDYERYVSAFVAEAETWVNEDSGRPAIDRISRADSFGDPRSAGGGADVMLWWSKAAPVVRVRSPRLGPVEGRHGENKSGEHVMQSLFMARHPDLLPGRRPGENVLPTDVAPTLLYLAGADPAAVGADAGRNLIATLKRSPV